MTSVVARSGPPVARLCAFLATLENTHGQQLAKAFAYFFVLLTELQKDTLETAFVGKVLTSLDRLLWMKFEERCSHLAAGSEECNSNIVGC
mmetsp:Transcript_11411/g.70029  ORF Transcript_11411/g.70029 Transcript_11411/m.70029 type:complete len:91 (-) Transcript_11411:1458-1730(-)